MTATMIAMEWTIVDTILVDTLELGDWINVAGEIVEIIEVFDDPESDNIMLAYRNDMDEEYEIGFAWDAQIDVYMIVETD